MSASNVQKVVAVVNRETCLGSQICTAMAPAAFRSTEDLHGEFYDADGATAALVLEVAATCPTMSITVTDAETGDKLFP